MEDYTYHLGPGTPKILGAHMLEVCPSIAADQPRIEIHPLGIGNREDPVRLVFDAAPGPATVLGICDLGDRFRLVLNEVDVVATGRAAAQAAGRPCGLGAEAGPGHVGRVVDHRRRPAPHRAVDRGRHRPAGRLRQPARRRAVGHRRRDQPARVRRPDPLEPGLLPPGPRVLSDGRPTRAGPITEGRTALGIELGSTRIKAVLTGPDHAPIAVGSHDWENQFVDRLWTYSLDAVWSGLRQCYAALAADVRAAYDVELTDVGALGVSAMMHGYLAFDADGELLTPFRTWRNTNTGEAAERLSAEFGHNIPHRWSVAHLYQAILERRGSCRHASPT